MGQSKIKGWWLKLPAVRVIWVGLTGVQADLACGKSTLIGKGNELAPEKTDALDADLIHGADLMDYIHSTRKCL